MAYSPKDYIKAFIKALIKAEREEIVEKIKELPIVLVDTKFNPDDLSKVKQAVLLEDILQELNDKV